MTTYVHLEVEIEALSDLYLFTNGGEWNWTSDTGVCVCVCVLVSSFDNRRRAK